MNFSEWLKAGVLETDGQVNHPVRGTPQGGSISPILANIYLHNALDEWFEETVRAHYCIGHVYLCRYADDFVCAFQYAQDAQRFYQALNPISPFWFRSCGGQDANHGV